MEGDLKEYRHGVRVEEEGSYVAAPAAGTAGLQVIFGTAPVNLAAVPEAAVNTPVVCRTIKDAVTRRNKVPIYCSFPAD